ncbi:MAG: ArsR/SmtB family transcription factor [Gemmataceae bacterium]
MRLNQRTPDELLKVTTMQDKLQSRHCARSLRALADSDRLQIVQCLLAGPRNVSEIAALLRLEVANVSHHLGVLRHAGIVLDQKQGKFVIYSLHPDVFRPDAADPSTGSLDLGCCRLDLSGEE